MGGGRGWGERRVQYKTYAEGTRIVRGGGGGGHMVVTHTLQVTTDSYFSLCLS